MPDTVNLVLVLLVGVAVGVFFTLVFDSSFLTKRLQEEKNQQLRLENKIILARTEIKHLRKDLEAAAEWQEQAAYLRTKKEELEQKLATADCQLETLEAQVRDTQQQLADAQELRRKIARVSEQNTEARASLESLKRKLAEAQNRVAYMRLGGKENLTLIRGIGPAYARRLQEAGIRTLSALAKTSPDRLCEILQIKPWQNAAPREWVAEAKQLAAVFSDEEE